MQFEGLVISTNETLWTFEIENKVTFYAPNWACGTFRRLPAVNSRVIVINDHHQELNTCTRKYALCNESVIHCSQFSQTQRATKFLSVISRYRLGIPDILRIDEYLLLTRKFIQPLVQCSPEDIVVSIFDALGKICLKERPTHKLICLSKKLSKVVVKTPTDITYVNDTNDSYKQFPHYSFGIHSAEQREVLIGYLYVDKELGLRFIKDTNVRWPCFVITSRTWKDLGDGLVALRNYRIYTEIYNQPRVSPMEYVVVDADDLFELNPPNNVTMTMLSPEPANLKFKYNFKFLVLYKSTLLVNLENTYEYWLKIKSIESRTIKFIVMNNNYLQLYPRFELNHVYEIYHQQLLLPYKWFEDQGLVNIPTYLISEGNIKVRHIGENPDRAAKEGQVLDVDGAMKHMRTSGWMCSFEGVIVEKKFVPPLYSKTKRSDSEFFGTAGVKTHVLNFKCVNGDNLVLYLNDLENSQTPFGLLPNMRVLIRNAVPQKNRYLKCCILTTFQIMRCELRVNLNSANLCSRNKSDKISFFGLGDLVPKSVLVRGTILQFNLQSVRMHCRCTTCDEFLPCNCQISEPQLFVTIKLYMSDAVGESILICKSTNLLRLLLGLERDEDWKLFIEMFEPLGTYTYNCPVDSHLCYDMKLLYNSIQMRLQRVSHGSLKNNSVMCRKMEAKLHDNDDLPLWFCINDITH